VDATAEAIGAASADAAAGTHPTSELHAEADYREHLARVLTKRAVIAAAGVS
jgi:carbon-monoxide dehydrogenase medium subunit